MNPVWYAATATTAAATTIAWQRRDMWHQPHTTPVKASLLLGVGLLLVSPLGEPWGDQMHYIMRMHNIEDFHGHFFMLAAAATITRRAFINLRWDTRHIVTLIKIQAVLIMVIGACTRTVLTPSSSQNPADTGYWVWTSVVLAPAFALAAYAHTRVAIDCPKARVSATLHAAPLAIGFLGSLCRFVPGVPVIAVYWCYIACVAGLLLAAHEVWRRVWIQPLKTLAAL